MGIELGDLFDAIDVDSSNAISAEEISKYVQASRCKSVQFHLMELRSEVHKTDRRFLALNKEVSKLFDVLQKYPSNLSVIQGTEVVSMPLQNCRNTTATP